MEYCINNKYILNGKLLPCDTFDPCHLTSGFSVYEVIRVIGGKYLFPEDHLDRLDSTIKISGLSSAMDHDELVRQFNILVKANHHIDGNVKLVFNYQGPTLSCYMMYYIPHQYPEEKDYAEGVRLVSLRFVRIDPHKKIWRQDFRELVSCITLAEKAWDVLLVDKERFITEASKANIFLILKNVLYTPPLTEVLPGITRKHIFTICAQKNISLFEKMIPYDELGHYDACFITGTSPKVLSVSQIDHYRFPVPHKLITTLVKAYNQIINNYLSA